MLRSPYSISWIHLRLQSSVFTFANHVDEFSCGLPHHAISSSQWTPADVGGGIKLARKVGGGGGGGA